MSKSSKIEALKLSSYVTIARDSDLEAMNKSKSSALPAPPFNFRVKKMIHLDLCRRGPKGTVDAEWQCLDCGKRGTLTELGKDIFCCDRPKKSNDQRILDAIEGKDETNSL